jgi:hypothetical protein
MRPRADLTISRFFEPRKTAVVAINSLSVASEISSSRQPSPSSGSVIRLTLELKDQSGKSADTGTDHVWCGTRQTGSNHRNEFFDICFD